MEILGIKFNEFSVADQSISSAPAKLKAEWGYSLATGKYHTSLHIIYPDTGRSMLMLMEGDCQDDFEEFDDIATEFNGDESLPEIWKSSVIEAKQYVLKRNMANIEKTKSEIAKLQAELKKAES